MTAVSCGHTAKGSCAMCTPAPRLDEIDGPPHYQAPNGMEAIDVIEGFQLGFNLGNAIKYILRAGRKGDRTTDLRKAVWYLQREIGGGS
ncbi:MAG TPA: DUF3310 domain-containing protein [Mycobacterium sp.]|nr:DUF3310 domain-containing protein [Mycobacterium sp.]